MKCPIYEICVTPNLYNETTHTKYVQDVCSTEEHKKCTHYQFGLHPKNGSEEWNRTKRWLEKIKR